ncbi:MAG TPA: hypothetical protein VF748_00455 [Candidatus Acidoferrum sp.]
MAMPAFPCPLCNKRMDTKDSRPTTFHGKPSVRRRKRCSKCGWVVTTYEVQDDLIIQSEARLIAVANSLRRTYEAIGVLLAEYDAAEMPGAEPGAGREETGASVPPA